MIRLIKSTFIHEQETKEALAEFILNESILSMGEQCRKFEIAFAAKQQTKHAVYVGNGSVANLLLIQSMMNTGYLSPGDRVGFSALTWPTNVMPLIQLGLVPVAIDCEIETLNISPRKLEEKIGTLRALFLTNVLGFCDEIEQIKDMCTKNEVIFLEDNCESLGSQINGKLLGNFGLASTFSFFVGHHMSTIEGGMVCTSDDHLHEYLVMGRAHGWDRNLAPSTQATLRGDAGITEFYAKYTFYDLASNFRPTEINGFIGNTQIAYWDHIVGKRAENFAAFEAAIRLNDDFYQYELKHMDVISNFSMPVICKTPELAEKYRTRFSDANVEIRPVIAGNMTKQPFYKKYVQDESTQPNSDLIHANGFYFGNNPELTDFEVVTLCELLKK
ncbi:MAG TPA: DegT/DnrJ/EryC1/StrS family aminotransferase [Acidimicrobiia bacterium]|nr:DegT/DnrJ/EryC1/StrS family aminotransferase [Acidimicrobiia bacterium]